MRTPLRTTALLTLGAASLLLSACSVGYSAPAAPAAPSEIRNTPTADAPRAATPSASATSSPAPSANGAATGRAAYEGRVQKVLSCPGGSLELASTGTAVRLDGDCTSVNVTGTGIVVLAQAVTTLTVTGSANTVFLASAGTIDITGTGNEVRWDAGTPVVSDTGTGSITGPATEQR